MTNEYVPPMDVRELTSNLIQELFKREAVQLPLNERRSGAGVYALFYHGDFEPYAPVISRDSHDPIYVGKAMPSGSRKGQANSEEGYHLINRLKEHTESIALASNLRLEDFSCRYLVVSPIWITMAERLMIEKFQPIWNVQLDGFGNHDPGRGRREGSISWWDAMHPGRPWAKTLRPIRSQEDAELRLKDYFAELKLLSETSQPQIELPYGVS